VGFAPFSIAMLTACMTACAGEDSLERWPGKASSAPPAAMVEPRKPALEKEGSYPCSECHDGSFENDPTERELAEAHDDLKLQHGDGRFWCTQCHAEDRGMLRDLKGRPIDFDAPQELCVACHSEEVESWRFGGHGKRLANWRGERRVLTCTACHDAHDPSIKPRKAWRREAHVQQQ
jgi:hypothetical protein